MEGKQLTDKEFENIENYLMYRMPEAERASFEQQLSEDKLLQAHVEEVKQLIMAVEASAVADLMDDFHQEIKTSQHNELSPKTKTNLRTLWTPYLVAASFLILIALFSIWYFQSTPAHEKLFARHFVADPGLITPMSAQDNYLFYAGMVDYRMGDYENAIQKWQELLLETPATDTLAYFLGVANLAANNTSEALLWLQKTNEFQESVFRDEMWFYLGLTYLKKGNLSEARNAFLKSETMEANAVLNDLD